MPPPHQGCRAKSNQVSEIGTRSRGERSFHEHRIVIWKLTGSDPSQSGISDIERVWFGKHSGLAAGSDPLGKRSLVLVLAMAALAARAISQEIVIEPTNGKAAAQGKVRVSRPAASESTPAQTKPAAKPIAERPATKTSAKAPAKKATLKQVSAKSKTTPVEAVSTPEPPKIEAPAPPVKKMPARPQWALADNRDANSLQSEIANALSRDPKLTGSTIQVIVDEESVTLAGQAAGTEERLQAVRLARSYAWNRKLLDKIDVVRSVAAQK